MWAGVARGTGRACAAVVQASDRVGAGFERSLDSIRKRLGARPIALTLPVGSEANFSAVIDVVKMKLLNFDPDSEGEKIVEHEIPPDLKEEAQAYRDQAVEAAAEFDDALMAKYLDGQALSEAEIRLGLRKGTLACKIVPARGGPPPMPPRPWARCSPPPPLRPKSWVYRLLPGRWTGSKRI